MGVRIAHDREADIAILYCSTTGVAFGPVFDDGDDHDAVERVEAFLRWLNTIPAPTWYGQYDPAPSGRVRDPRDLSEQGIQRAYLDWLAQEPDQYAQERLRALLKDEEDDVLLEHEVSELAALRARFPELVGDIS